MAGTCTGCGLPLAETTDVDRADLYDAEAVVCHACAAGDRAINAIQKAPNADMAGMRVRFIERPPYEPPAVTPD